MAGNVLILDFLQHEPAVIPAARGRSVRDDHPLGLVQAFRAERIACRQTAHLGEEIVRVDIVRPGVRQRFGNVGRAIGAKQFLNASQLDQGIDAMVLERLDDLGLVCAWQQRPQGTR